MNLKKILYATAGGLMAICLTQAVYAQQAPSSITTANYSVTLTPLATTTTPTGSAVTLGTVKFTNTSSGDLSISSLPITFTPSGGASSANLSNCQLYNSNNQVIATSMTMGGTAASPVETFTFGTAQTLPFGTIGTLTIRCDVSSATPSTGTFSLLLGTAPTVTSTGTTSTSTATTTFTLPSLFVSVQPNSTITTGTTNAPLAFITLDARQSGTPVTISSLPISTTFTGGLNSGNFTNCRLMNTNNLNTALNTGNNSVGTLVNGSGSINLDTPLVINAGTQTTLLLSCDVSSFAPNGSVLGVTVTPTGITATNPNTNSTFTPSASSLPFSGQAQVLGASTTGTGTGTTGGTGTTPGIPNTGLGGNAINFYLLLALALMFGTSGIILTKKKVA